jgi:hypothetical protein
LSEVANGDGRKRRIIEVVEGVADGCWATLGFGEQFCGGIWWDVGMGKVKVK